MNSDFKLREYIAKVKWKKTKTTKEVKTPKKSKNIKQGIMGIMQLGLCIVTGKQIGRAHV